MPPRVHLTDNRRWFWAAVDTALLIFSVFAAATLRYDFEMVRVFTLPIATFTIAAAVLHVAIGALRGPYTVGHVRGSYEEIIDISRSVTLWSVPLFIVGIAGVFDPMPRSLPLISAMVAALAMFGARFFWRAARTRPTDVDSAEKRVIVFGAGEGGRQVIRALVRDQASAITPVAVIDDDSRKRRLKIDGVRVLGNRNDLPKIAEVTRATTLAVAVPSADSELIQSLNRQAEDLSLDVMVLPTTSEMLGRPQGSDLRSLDVRDLLGRRPIELDRSGIATAIQGKVVLVTGAGGSIGSELCRQIEHFGPAKLVMLDRDESALHSVQISVTGRGMLDSDDVVLADIRDEARLHEIFQNIRPQVVFHAAALKHLPLLEQYPEEAWKTNVLGTLNVLRAAHAAGVENFVNVSTDKAANPSCVLGYSKRLTERLTASFADKDQGTYVSVRFGNVLGSRGSVIAAFTSLIEKGGPVTVTHPDVERYFMLIPEACQLVLQSAAIGRDGEVMVLEMGSPVKIDDVARTLINLSGRRNIDIVYTGLRPGEKMSEELFSPGENLQPTDHSLVTSVSVPRIREATVSTLKHSGPSVAAQWMKDYTVPGNEVNEQS